MHDLLFPSNFVHFKQTLRPSQDEVKSLICFNVFFQIKREIATMKLIKHPNVVRLYEVADMMTFLFINLTNHADTKFDDSVVLFAYPLAFSLVHTFQLNKIYFIRKSICNKRSQVHSQHSLLFCQILILTLKHFCLQVMGSRTKIYIVLEFVTGGELFDKIVSK